MITFAIIILALALYTCFAAYILRNGDDFAEIVNRISLNVSLGLSGIRSRARRTLCSTRGENYVDSGVKILIAVVIGALLLGGLYALFGDTILPTVTRKVEEMFEFHG